MNTNIEETMKELYAKFDKLEKRVLSRLEKLIVELKDNIKQQPTCEPKRGRWKPEHGKKYGYIAAGGWWHVETWLDSEYDQHRFTLGNCYQVHEEYRAIWEQVTRRQYDQALRDAADWDGEGYWHHAYFDDEILSLKYSDGNYVNLPRFANEESCIEAHTRILSNDAKRYFTGEL